MVPLLNLPLMHYLVDVYCSMFDVIMIKQTISVTLSTFDRYNFNLIALATIFTIFAMQPIALTVK